MRSAFSQGNASDAGLPVYETDGACDTCARPIRFDLLKPEATAIKPVSFAPDSRPQPYLGDATSYLFRALHARMPSSRSFFHGFLIRGTIALHPRKFFARGLDMWGRPLNRDDIRRRVLTGTPGSPAFVSRTMRTLLVAVSMAINLWLAPVVNMRYLYLAECLWLLAAACLGSILLRDRNHTRIIDAADSGIGK